MIKYEVHDRDLGTFWYLNGKLHREEAPAVTYTNGDEAWYLNGQLHREDGPAYDGIAEKHWYINGIRHRENGPASTYPDGSKIWYVDGNIHRIDGPAIEYINGGDRWFLNGGELSVVDWKREVDKLKPRPTEGIIRESHYKFIDDKHLPVEVRDELCNDCGGNGTGRIVNPECHPKFKAWLIAMNLPVECYIIWWYW